MDLLKVLKITCVSMVLTACGGGGGGGTSTSLPEGVLLSVSATVSPTSLPRSYQFPVAAGKAYSVVVQALSGDPDLLIADVPSNTSTVPSYFGFSSTSNEYDSASFISQNSDTAYAWVYAYFDSASYRVTVNNNHLTVGGNTRDGVSDSSNTYYSFEVTAGTAYKITLDSNLGNSDLELYNSVSPSLSYPLTYDVSGLLKSSTNSGNATDTVTFLATQSGMHYIAVNPDGASPTYEFTVGIEETTAAPDLVMSIDNLVQSAGSMDISYTVTNIGLTEAGAFNIHFLSDSAITPTAGTISGDTTSHAGLAASATISGTITLTAATESGTAYAIVDPEDSVIESDDSNNVSTGIPWTAPIIAPVAIDFEDALIPFAFVNSGDANWDIDQVNNPVGSNYSLRSGTITHSQTSCFEVSIGDVSRLRFDYKVDSEGGYDYLRLYKDGSFYWSASGLVDWTTHEVIVNDANVHNYRWCYMKDSIYSVGLDSAWVDNIVAVATPSDLVVTISGASSDGSQVTLDYAVLNQGAGDAPASVLQLWSSSATAPVVGDLGETQVSIPALVAGATHIGTITITNSNSVGTAYALIDTDDVVIESSVSNNVSAGVSWIGGTPIASHDFEDGLVPGSFTMSGNAAWVIDSTTAATGTYSLRSGTIIDSQSSCVAISATNSTTILFDWNVNSESGYDYLRFYIDSVQQTSSSGTTGSWSQQSHSSTTGNHEYMWCYTKDGSVSTGSDAGWIDNIAIY